MVIRRFTISTLNSFLTIVIIFFRTSNRMVYWARGLSDFRTIYLKENIIIYYNIYIINYNNTICSNCKESIKNILEGTHCNIIYIQHYTQWREADNNFVTALNDEFSLYWRPNLLLPTFLSWYHIASRSTRDRGQFYNILYNFTHTLLIYIQIHSVI